LLTPCLFILPPLPFPPTIIVVHPKERRSKCSVEPLRGRHGFVFWKWPHCGAEPLNNYVRLGLGGPELSPADTERGLLLLDGTWKLVAKMEPRFAHLPVRGLSPTWKTAYPRVSKLTDDPATGLATIEALYAAYVTLGRDTTGLLDHYHWRDDFLQKNASNL
jgi:pre-rRNA-processing protein TSR3